MKVSMYENVEIISVYNHKVLWRIN
jgi:hypothetical protein